MITLAVDPSLHASGWCLLDGEKPVKWGVVLIPPEITGNDALAILVHEARDIDILCQSLAPIDLLVYEEQYGGKAGWKSTSLVSIAAGVWIGAVRAKDIRSVLPMTWGAAFSLPHKKEKRKAASIRVATAIHREKYADWQEDAAEAFLIGLWAAREAK
jgi:hypothetical protein